MNLIEKTFFISWLLIKQVDTITVTSCSKEDFFLRKVNKRFLISAETPKIFTGVTNYQQCFGKCQQYNCSIFNFQNLGENDYKCSVHSGMGKTRFSPSVRFRSEPSDLLFFERLSCQQELNEISLQGSFHQATTCKEVRDRGGAKSGTEIFLWWTIS